MDSTIVNQEYRAVTDFQTAAESRAAGVTYHLSPVEVWQRQKDQDEYLPEAYEVDGFIHCTDGLENLLRVGNMFYTGDRREFCVLVLKTGDIRSEIRYEDPEEIFPHIYGPLNTSAVQGEMRVLRGDDGTFLSFAQ